MFQAMLFVREKTIYVGGMKELIPSYNYDQLRKNTVPNKSELHQQTFLTDSQEMHPLRYKGVHNY